MDAAVADCLARVPALRFLTRDWLSANHVLFLDGNGARHGAVLVDTGYGAQAAETVAFIEGALEGRPLAAVLNTHLHSDHCGGNAALQAAHDCVVLIPPGEADAVARWDEEALSYRATCQVCPWFSFDGLIAPGDVLRLGGVDWTVHAAPGHDPHSVMLFAPDARLLISADALWEQGVGVNFPALRGEPGFDAALATLDHIEALAPDCVLPGHGGAFTDVAGAIARSRKRLTGWRDDPAKHAMYALKVLIQFLLLERGRFTLDEITWVLTEADYARQANARFLNLPPAVLAQQVGESLQQSGAARFDGETLQLPVQAV